MLDHVEVEQNISVMSNAVSQPDILERFSSYSRALRVIACMFRFVRNTCKRLKSQVSTPSSHFCQAEVNFAKTRLISLAQKSVYADEYSSLEKNEPISAKCPIRPLNPFIDQ